MSDHYDADTGQWVETDDPTRSAPLIWCEWYMGVPHDWTDVAWPPASAPSAIRSSRKKSNGSDGA